MCLIYSIVFSEFVSSQHFAVFSQWHFADFQWLSGGYFSIFTLSSCQFSCPFCQFLGIFSLLLLSLFFVLFAVFLQQPLSSFCIFILVEDVFYFLEFQFEFLFVLAICYCNQSMSIIFSCVHHFLISPIWKQQEKQNKTEQLDRWRNYPVCLTRYHSLQTKWVI